MNEKIKLDLVLKNECQEKYRKQETASAISKAYSLSKEIGILGDAVEHLFNSKGVTAPPAFVEWRSKVAEIKEAISKGIAEIASLKVE